MAQQNLVGEMASEVATPGATSLEYPFHDADRCVSAAGIDLDPLRNAVDDALPAQTWSRRAVDIVLSFLALVLLSPLLAAIAVAVMWDSRGGPLYLQWRTGYLGQRFRMFKFRTMVRNADELRDTLRHRSHLAGPDFKIVDDPRVTRIGRLIRRWSLDEVPQLFNVLKGDMTLVGPRPTSFSKEEYELWQLRRLTVKPGLTGLWQISGRSNVDFADRVRLDLRYIDERSVWRDVVILFKTPWAVLRGDGAR